MMTRRLPDLSPHQVIRLQDALLANADTLLNSALAVLDLGNGALARSLAILGLEESGKAIAIHQRRVAICSGLEGETFRCDKLDELWGSHQKKLEVVHEFLVNEPYWFDTEPPNPDETSAYLGTIKAWAQRHDKSKQRGFYVDLGRDGTAVSPTDVADVDSLRAVIAHVHQIGWQLRLGEHIEGKYQDEQEAGLPPSNDGVAWLNALKGSGSGEDTTALLSEVTKSLGEGIPGQPLSNAQYRFNQPGADQGPFHSLGKAGYEAETRELQHLANQLDQDDNL